MFGISEKGNAILELLFTLRDTPQSPPDPRITLFYIAEILGMTIEEAKIEIEKLEKRRYVVHIIIEGKRYYRLTQRGNFEIMKCDLKTTSIEASTDKIGVKRKKVELISDA
jgi:hypothetical protein